MKKCNICFKEMRSDNLRRHMRRHQNSEKLPYLNNLTSDLPIDRPIPARLDETEVDEVTSDSDSNSDEKGMSRETEDKTVVKRVDLKDSHRSLKELNSYEEAYIVKELQQLVQTVVDEYQNNRSIVPILNKYWTQLQDL